MVALTEISTFDIMILKKQKEDLQIPNSKKGAKR